MPWTILDKSSNRQAPFCLKQQTPKIFMIRGMTEAQTEAMFNETLCARVHQLRNDRGYTSVQMATALGLPADRYRKYEYRSPLPAYLWERFALIVGCDVDDLLTGRAAKSRKTTTNRENRAA